jgi:hypothetical protein
VDAGANGGVVASLLQGQSASGKRRTPDKLLDDVNHTHETAAALRNALDGALQKQTAELKRKSSKAGTTSQARNEY